MGNVWVLLQISHALQQCKNFENRFPRFDKVTESLKVETFLRHSKWLFTQVDSYCNAARRPWSLLRDGNKSTREN